MLTTYTAEGWFTVNVLLVLKPFKIVAGASAGVSISAGDRELMGVQLRAHLEGPQPWYATGTATFTFFGLDVDFGFDVGSQPGGEPREIYPVGPDVAAAMRVSSGWVAADPAVAWGTGVVMGDQLPEGLWVRPDQTVEVRQSLAPLNRTITAYGEYIPASDRIEAGDVILAGLPVAAPVWVEDWFAPAQFDRLDDTSSLSAPSYELMTAGVCFGDDEIGISSNPDYECTSASREPEESIYGEERKIDLKICEPSEAHGRHERPPQGGRPADPRGPHGVHSDPHLERRAGAAVLAGAGVGKTMSYADAVGVLERRADADPSERSRLRVAPSHAAMERTA